MLIIDYFSDVLCVWAWIAQRRIDELEQEFGDQIAIRHRYMDIFGAVDSKMTEQWAQRGGYEGFAEHVMASASSYENAPVNTDNWAVNRPTSSAAAHLYIKAVEFAEDAAAATKFARALREAFFVHAADISQRSLLIEILNKQQLHNAAVTNALDGGQAMAALMADYQCARGLYLRGSPSYVMNGERQILYGNVGYRVLSANVEELLKQVHHEASWC